MVPTCLATQQKTGLVKHSTRNHVIRFFFSSQIMLAVNLLLKVDDRSLLCALSTDPWSYDVCIFLMAKYVRNFH